MSVLEACTVLSNEKISDLYYEMIVYAPEIAARAKPGQFVHINCGEADALRRPISICDVDSANLRIVYEIRGKGTNRLSQLCKGISLDILGPLGDGIFPITKEPVLLVGGGCGAPPLLFAAKSCINPSAVLGFRTSGCVILTDEFYAACDNLLIATDDGSMGAHGTVEKPIRLLLSNNKFSSIFACGPKPMLKAVAAIASEHKIPCYVSMEERMACGVGACLCCACKTKSHDSGEGYSHVCKDGPVFNAEKIIWE